jgi:hypothetical protein
MIKCQKGSKFQAKCKNLITRKMQYNNGKMLQWSCPSAGVMSEQRCEFTANVVKLLTEEENPYALRVGALQQML